MADLVLAVAFLGLGILVVLAIIESVAHAAGDMLPGDRSRFQNLVLVSALLYLLLKLWKRRN
jgi:hypothetical protein